MKTTKTFEIEIERHGVTPAQFLAYLRSMQKKHPEMANDFDLNMFSREGWSFDYSNALPTERPCESERGTDKPYQKQTYIRNFDGTTYNEIIEFDFDDEKTGHGYYYTVQIDVADEDREANTAENVAAIIRRRAEQADRQEARAEKAEQEANDANPEYTANWWVESKRTEAATLRREASETRAAIKATQEAQEAPQEAPAAEAEQQPTETENAPQAATQAAEQTTTNEQKEEDNTMSTERYDYIEHMTEDVIDAIRESYTDDEIRARLDDDRDEFAQTLNDDLWIDDSVTGNASGSYYCNAWRAEEAIAHNWDLIADMIDEFDAADILRKGPEAIDVSIRCYLLGQAIDAALDQLDEEIPEAEEPDEDTEATPAASIPA